MLPSIDEIGRNKAVSLNLFEVLDDLSLSNEVRRISIESINIKEILESLPCLERFSVYLMGSQGEGSTSPEFMDSDIDAVTVPTHVRVFTDLTSQCSDGFLVVPDRQPGYARLQLVKQSRPVTTPTLDKYFTVIYPDLLTLRSDNIDRVCLTRNLNQSIRLTDSHQQGPAINIHGTRHMTSTDYVLALNCDMWPEWAREWLTRERQHGWPSSEVIDKCKSLGFLVVHVGHPDSDESDLQWRLSFSHQELLLVRGFNSVQMTCFVLLKVIKKQFIELYIKEETLTSYHCKTCMFYCIENTRAELWVPENLAGCLRMCLRQLKVWISNNNCPNYFIPGENMFDRIRSGALKNQLSIYLNSILTRYDIFIKALLQDFQIAKCRLQKEMETKPVMNERLELTVNHALLSKKLPFRQCNVGLHYYEGMRSTLVEIMLCRNIIIFECCNGERFMKTDKLQNKITELKQTTRVGVYTEEQSKEVITLVLPFLQVNLLSLLVVKTIEERKEKLPEILNDEKWAKINVVNGSSKLKQACAMIMLGHPDAALEILLNINKKVALCACYCGNLPALSLYIADMPYNRRITMIKRLLKDFYQPCVVFLPNEHHTTPLAVNYEMLRSFGRSSWDSENLYLKYWSDWGVVEGIFLAQFLLYVNLKTLGQDSLATKALKKMIRICNKKTPYHLDTSYNLLGFVFKDRGDVTRAVECFQKSMRVQPTFNAACWHFCFLICGCKC